MRKYELFQFTPLREGRREANFSRENIEISIHAPPRGATWFGFIVGTIAYIISIHAPPRGATIRVKE